MINLLLKKGLLKRLGKNPTRVLDIFWGYEWMNRYKNRFNQNMFKQASSLDTLSKVVTIGGGLLGTAVAGYELYEQIAKRLTAKKMFQSVVERDPYLSQLPKKDLEEYFETISHVSPTIASNPLLLRTTLRQMASYEGADPSSIKLFTEVESGVSNPVIKPLTKLYERLMIFGKAMKPEKEG